MKSNSSACSEVILCHKREGQTPLEVVQDLKTERHEYAALPIAYAGRLDPMAEGDLLLLVGSACRERKHYLNLDKEYEFEVLLGAESDTQDILGLSNVTGMLATSCAQELKGRIEQVVTDLQGRQSFPYPAFSSKTVAGKPLFQWALEGRLSEVELPTKEVEVYRLDYRASYNLDGTSLLRQIQKRIAKVSKVHDPGKALGRDFRRKEVLDLWKNNIEIQCLQKNPFTIVRFRCICSSGTYMRTLARLIGEGVGTGGLAWRIKRTRIGRYRKWGPLGIWTKTYK